MPGHRQADLDHTLTSTGHSVAPKRFYGWHVRNHVNGLIVVGAVALGLLAWYSRLPPEPPLLTIAMVTERHAVLALELASKLGDLRDSVLREKDLHELEYALHSQSKCIADPRVPYHSFYNLSILAGQQDSKSFGSLIASYEAISALTPKFYWPNVFVMVHLGVLSAHVRTFGAETSDLQAHPECLAFHHRSSPEGDSDSGRERSED